MISSSNRFGIIIFLFSSLNSGPNFMSMSLLYCTKKMKFSVKDLFSKCDQIRRKLRIWSHLLKKFLKENFIFCAVLVLELLQFLFIQDLTKLPTQADVNPPSYCWLFWHTGLQLGLCE